MLRTDEKSNSTYHGPGCSAELVGRYFSINAASLTALFLISFRIFGSDEAVNTTMFFDSIKIVLNKEPIIMSK
ncbi:MAG: hypothetical protein ABJB85_11090 [Nitrososphaerota archaeon]